MKRPFTYARAARYAGIVVATAGSLTFQAQAASPESQALPAGVALLAASALPIGRAASCHGVLPGIAEPTLGALVASRLVYLNGGKNEIGGRCGEGGNPLACRVTINHADGEDVASAEFRFRLVDGRLDPASLVCVLTP